MKKIKIIQAVLIIIFLTLITSNAYSVIFPKYCLEDLCKRSSNVVRATVSSITYFKEDNKIFTSIYFQTVEPIKGDLEKSGRFEIIRYGGTIDSTTVSQAFAPTFHIGEEVLLFLNEFISKQFGRNYSIQGLSEGKFTIKNDEIYRNCEVPLKVKSTLSFYDISSSQKAIQKDIILNQVRNIIK